MTEDVAILVIFSTPPNGSEKSINGFDLLVAYAALDVSCAVYFVGPGVMHLQTPTTNLPHYKMLNKQIKTLSLYGITEVFAEQSAIKQYNVDEPVIDAEYITPEDFNKRFQSIKTHIVV